MSGEMEEADTGGETDRDEEDRDTEGPGSTSECEAGLQHYVASSLV